MKRATALCAAALLLSCRQTEAPVPAPTVAAPATAAPTTLAGEWRVAGIDGAPFDEPYGLALSADGRLVWMEPRCAGAARSYRITGGRITFGPDPAARSEVCAIGMPPGTDDVLRALDAAKTVRRTQENGIEIAGGGHSLTLFSQ